MNRTIILVIQVIQVLGALKIIGVQKFNGLPAVISGIANPFKNFVMRAVSSSAWLLRASPDFSGGPRGSAGPLGCGREVAPSAPLSGKSTESEFQ